MRLQEIFDKVLGHLIAQNKQALDLEGGCVYKSEEGLSCAVGCLIKDDEYHEQREGYGVDDLVDFKESFGSLSKIMGTRISTKGVRLLADLQELHDNANYWPEGSFAGWVRAETIGREYGLHLPKVVKENL